MTERQVLALLDLLDTGGVEVCIDGGWGVDALIGEQTRDHDDLDVVIDVKRVGDAIVLLGERGFEISVDERPTRFEMLHEDGRRIDFHPVTYDEEGGGTQQLPAGSTYRYPPSGLNGRGVIGGRSVRCIDVATQLECHLGYQPDEKDHHDMQALHTRLGVEVPPQFD